MDHKQVSDMLSQLQANDPDRYNSIIAELSKPSPAGVAAGQVLGAFVAQPQVQPCSVCNGQCATGQGQLCSHCNGSGHEPFASTNQAVNSHPQGSVGSPVPVGPPPGSSVGPGSSGSYGSSSSSGVTAGGCMVCNGPLDPVTGTCPVCQVMANQVAPAAPLPDEKLDWSFTKEDMIDLLDLSSRDGGYIGETVEISEGIGIQAYQAEVEESSTTALATDRWTKRRGKELVQSEWNGIDPTTGVGLPKCDEFELADAYAASFEIDPKVAKSFASPEAKIRAQWYASLLQSDDFQASRTLTIGDVDLSEIGAESLSESWVEYRVKITEEQKKEAEQQGLDNLGGPSGIGSKIGMSGSAAKAAAKAAQHIHEANGGGQGIGMDGQSDGGRKNPKAAKKLFSLMKNDRHFRKIMEIAGKMRQVLRAKQGAKLVRGAEEVVDIALSGNVRNILPSELAKLDSPMRQMMLQKVMSGKALSRKKASVRPVGKGPIVVYLDESGSMDSCNDPKDPENTVLANGKAMALTMARMAMMQNRWCMLVGFADSMEGNVCVLKPGQWDTEALMEWVTHFYCGGTTLNCALVRGPFGYNDGVKDIPSYWEEYQIPKGKTDILLISDGLVHVPKDVQDRFNEWKKEEGAKLYSIIINADPGPVADVSDRCWKVESFGVMSEAVSDMCGL